MKLLGESKRKFEGKGETERKMKVKGIMKKDHKFYNLRENLWNESSFLQPELARYSADNIDPSTTFKKEVRNLPHIR